MNKKKSTKKTTKKKISKSANAVRIEKPDKRQERLQKEVDKQRATIQSDQYSTSIGEIVSMYQRDELDIHPEFQRYYRWTDFQKSRFIESILLGIPIPSFFVSQRGDGKWDVVDGLQRISTILQFLGVLKDEDEELVPPLLLTRVHLLPALEGMSWEGTLPLSAAQQLYVKRSKLDFKIILRESSESAKFELFQRLNTGGTQLSDQELRNAMLLASVPKYHQWLSVRSQQESFRDCVVLSDRSYEERFDMELVLRFQLLHDAPISDVKKMQDLSDYLTDGMKDSAKVFGKWSSKGRDIFEHTFDILAEACGGDAFRKWDAKRGRFTGGFSISAFEVVAMGVGHAVANGKAPAAGDVDQVVRGMWSDTKFLGSSGSGVRASTRIPIALAYGRSRFA